MSFRFRKSIKIVPGVKLNIGKRGMSVSAGVRGARITTGTSGTRITGGIPGSGMSVSRKVGSTGRGRTSASHQQQEVIEFRGRIELDDEDGSVKVLDSDGSPLPQEVIKMFWQHKAEEVAEWLEAQAKDINSNIEDILDIHCKTPNPKYPKGYMREAFPEPEPVKPELSGFNEPEPALVPDPRKPFLARFSETKRNEHEEQVRQHHQDHEQAVKDWQSRKTLHEAHCVTELQKWESSLADWKKRRNAHSRAEGRKERAYDEELRNNVELMETVLEEALKKIKWPRETLIDFDISDNGETVWIDVDLPEIEDLPKTEARVAATNKRLIVKEKSETRQRKDYMTHVHGIAFLLAGTVFHSLPKLAHAVISGYSQRTSESTGHVEDEYLFSFRVPREPFSKINFFNLHQLDPVKALEKFEARREMTKTGLFDPIEPFQQPDIVD